MNALGIDPLFAMQCALLALVGPSDEVLLVERVDARFQLALRLTRTRARHASAHEVFDAIGAHTRALVLLDPTDAELELAAFELPLLLILSASWKHRPIPAVRVEIRLHDAGADVYGEGLTVRAQRELEQCLDADPKGLPQ